MFDFLSRSRTKPDKTPPMAVPAPTAPAASPASPSTTQREMVRLTLHNVLRHNGIPGNWISCDMVPIQLPQHGNTLLLQLVVHHWHDALMHYAVALQQEFLAGLKHFDPHVDPQSYVFSWKFAPDCGCPHTQFPAHAVWSTPASPHAASLGKATPTMPVPIAPLAPSVTTAATAMAAAKPKFDLPPTAADLRQDDDDDDHGFAATQINPL